MAIKLSYYGQNDSVNCYPDVVLTGDPGTDQATLTAAGYLGGKIMAIKAAVNAHPVEPAFGSIGAIVPCDNDSMVPFAVLLNGPGEFSGAIGPSGSKKAPVVRALFQGMVNFEGYDGSASFTLGGYVFCGHVATHNNAGLYTDTTRKGTLATPVAICTHVPSATEPWLGVSSLL